MRPTVVTPLLTITTTYHAPSFGPLWNATHSPRQLILYAHAKLSCCRRRRSRRHKRVIRRKARSATIAFFFYYLTFLLFLSHQIKNPRLLFLSFFFLEINFSSGQSRMAFALGMSNSGKFDGTRHTHTESEQISGKRGSGRGRIVQLCIGHYVNHLANEVMGSCWYRRL